MLQDIAQNFHSLEEALNRITAKVLMVSCTSDMLFPTVNNQQMVEILQNQGKDAQLYKIESMKGHMAGVFDTHSFSNQIAEFLS